MKSKVYIRQDRKTMDINQYLSSSIIPRSDDLSFVQFPSFTGYSEVVNYKHRSISLSYWVQELFPAFRCDEVFLDIHRVILVSRILWHVGVRIIDTDTIYDEELFLIESGEIFSFELMGNGYFAFIYRDIWGDEMLSTNTPKNGIFEAKIHHGIFTVENTLTGTPIFQKEYSLMRKKQYRKDLAERNTFYTCTFVPDPLFPQTREFLEWVSQIYPENIILTHSPENIMIEMRWLDEVERKKLIGFLGTYTCILPDISTEYMGYLRESEVIDGRFELPPTFEESEWVSLIDPRWHQIRLWLLEISYLASLIVRSEWELEKWIWAIDTLWNPHILLQRKRLESKLENIRKLAPHYLAQKEVLISLLKNKIT